MQVVVQTESAHALIPAFEILKEIDPTSCSKVVVIISDSSRAFINAWMAVFDNSIRHIVCSWHLEKNWALQIRAKHNTGSGEHENLIAELKNLCLTTTEPEFVMLYNILETKWVSVAYYLCCLLYTSPSPRD